MASRASTAGASATSTSIDGDSNPPTPGGAATREKRMSRTPLMDAKRRAAAARRKMDPASMGPAVDGFLNSAPAKLARRSQRSSIAHCERYSSEATKNMWAKRADENKKREGVARGLAAPPTPLATILKLERQDRKGSWNPSQPLHAALSAQQGRAPVPRAPPGDCGLPDHIEVAPWEWTTALVRCVLRHNVAWFTHSYKIVERGDRYFCGERGAAIEAAAARARPPRLWGPETMPGFQAEGASDDSYSSEEGDLPCGKQH